MTNLVLKESKTAKVIQIWSAYVYQFVVSALLILTCNSVFYKSPNIILFRMIQVSFFAFLLIAASISIYYILKKNKLLFYKLSHFLFIYSILFLVFLVMNNLIYPLNKIYFFTTYYFVPVCSIIFLSYRFACKKHIEILLRIENVIVVLAIYSLFMWLIGPELNILHRTGYYAISWGGIRGINSYYNIFFTAQGQINFLGMNLTRNTSIFSEAPIFAFVLNTAFFINLYIEKKLNYKTVILFLTLVSTTSTTGVILAVFAIFLKYILIAPKGNLFPIFRKPIIYLAAITVSIIGFYLIKRKMHMSSYSIRMDDLIAGWKAWMIHPIFGNGIENYGIFTKYMQSSRIESASFKGSSSGLMKVLAGGGIYLFSFYLLPILCLIKKNWSKDKNLVLFGMFLFIIFVFTIIDNVYLYLFIISWLWADFISGGNLKKMN